jgi:hypothetical protein
MRVSTLAVVCWIFSWAMSHICANAEYRSQVGATDRLRNIVIRMLAFEFENSRHFQFSFTDFSLVYRSAFAQIFSRSQPMKEFITSTRL